MLLVNIQNEELIRLRRELPSQNAQFRLRLNYQHRAFGARYLRRAPQARGLFCILCILYVCEKNFEA